MTTSRTPFHLEFESPPVVEVVCGVTFTQLDCLLAPHFGILWEKFRNDYPYCQEHAPLDQVIESTGASPQAMEIRFSDVPLLPRIWFLSPRADRIIQVQRDRFLHNWRKVDADDEYPRFKTVLNIFQERFSIFDAFLQETDLGTIELLQCELTYVNAISVGNRWNGLTEIGEVFPDFMWRGNQNRSLPEPEAINWRTTFSLPNKAGRLHVNVKNVLRADDRQLVLLMELTARGIGQDGSRESLWEWFNLAHDWIIRGFADLTSSELQKDVWRRKDGIIDK